MNRLTKETQSNAGIDSALQGGGGGRPKVKSFGQKSWMLPQPVLIIGTYDKNASPMLWTDGAARAETKLVWIMPSRDRGRRSQRCLGRPMGRKGDYDFHGCACHHRESERLP